LIAGKRKPYPWQKGAGVLGHLVLMIRIFRIQNSAVCSDLNLGVLYILEAEFLQKRRQVDQKTKDISAIVM
jgi:hypothetical protein